MEKNQTKANVFNTMLLIGRPAYAKEIINHEHTYYKSDYSVYKLLKRCAGFQYIKIISVKKPPKDRYAHPKYKYELTHVGKRVLKKISYLDPVPMPEGF